MWLIVFFFLVCIYLSPDLADFLIFEYGITKELYDKNNGINRNR
jgi:hypothetical protein